MKSYPRCSLTSRACLDSRPQDKAANTTDKSKLKPMTDVDLLKIKPYPIRDDINFFIHSEVGDSAALLHMLDLLSLLLMSTNRSLL